MGFCLGMRAFAFPASGLLPDFIKSQPLRYPRHDRVRDQTAWRPLLAPVYADIHLPVEIHVWQTSLALGKLKLRAQNSDARTPPKRVGDLDQVRVAQRMRPPVSSPNDSAPLERNGEARELRVHPADLLGGRELNRPLPNTRSRHGWYYESWGPRLPLQGRYDLTTERQDGSRCDLPASLLPLATWLRRSPRQKRL